MTEPWNIWHGLTEGDMIDELVELDALHGHYGTQSGYEKLTLEDIRRLWWNACGVFQFGDTEQIDSALDDQQAKYDL